MEGRTAVVVDPSSTVRRLVAQVLRTDGWVAIESTDCADALETVQNLIDANHPPDLVITAWVLEGADAPALIRVLRQRHGRIPTIVMTSLDNRPPLPTGVELLLKPFTPAALRSVVSVLCDAQDCYQGA